MEKIMIDERNGFEYELIGEQYYPTGRRMIDGVMTPSEPPEDDKPEEEKPIGIWGQRHLRYLWGRNKSLCRELFSSGKLYEYLDDVDRKAEDMFTKIVCAMKESEGISEHMKAEDPLRWIGLMNNIQNCATEIVDKELIFL